MCPSSGELIFLPAGWNPPIQSDKYQCRIDTVSSPDDGHIDARNMYRRENKYTKNCVHLVGLICKSFALFSPMYLEENDNNYEP